MSLWKVIAKKEIWLKTSRFRRKRKIVFIFIFGLFLFWAAYLGPILLDSIIPEIFKGFTGNFESVLVRLLENMCASLFLMYVFYPLFLLFKGDQISNNEIVLASPANSGDIFIGEFLGQLPFYFLFILGTGPFITAILLQFNYSLTIFHHIFTYIILFTLFVLGSLLGKSLAKWVEFKISTSERLNRIRNVSLVIISIVVLLAFFSLRFVIDLFQAHQDLRGYFLFYPSFWYSNLLLYSVNLGFVELYSLSIWLSLGLAFCLPFLLFFIIYKRINLLSNLNHKSQRRRDFHRKEEKVFQFFGKLTPQKYRGLLIIQIKYFFRKRENIIKIFYLLGIISFFGILLLFSLKGQTLLFNINILSIPLVIQVTFTKEILVSIISWMGGLIFGILMGISTYIESREILEIYKKSPMGVKGFVYPLLFNLLYQLIVFSFFFSIFFTIIFQLGFLLSLIFFMTFIINSLTILLQSIGFQLIKPRFNERRKSVVFVNYIVLGLQVFSLLITLYIFIPLIHEFFQISTTLIFLLYINSGISLGLAILIFFVGIWKIKRFE
ncbi:hypothetical protein LCGC14_0755230 [marine sediment metagenome]|uniref:Uncharacterized protein n=1 Tax=marine sediment metagenome TaxID=412755 RepID=A0A0F9T9T2_9ZZZZ